MPVRRATAETPWQTFTAIDRTDATEGICSALERHKEMVTPGTVEGSLAQLAASAIASQVAVSVMGSAAIGTGTRAILAPFGDHAPEVGFAVPMTYPLAAPTVASAALAAIPDASWELAAVAALPLVEPTPLVGFSVFTGDPRVQRGLVVSPSPSRAFRAFTQVAGWLGMTQKETARVLGVGRTTPLAWGRGHEPRPARARRLYQTHALLSTLVRRLGVDETRRWLARGEPSPLDLITAGDVATADDRAEALIFGTPAVAARLDAWVDEPAASEQPPSLRATPRLVSRSRPRRRER